MTSPEYLVKKIYEDCLATIGHKDQEIVRSRRKHLLSCSQLNIRFQKNGPFKHSVVELNRHS
jgi:hypothetical protein